MFRQSAEIDINRIKTINKRELQKYRVFKKKQCRDSCVKQVSVGDSQFSLKNLNNINNPHYISSV